MSKRYSTQNIVDYYDDSFGFYKRFMDRHDHRMMHMGYFDEDNDTPGDSVVNLVRQTVDAIDVGPDDVVLDAGCGIGGPATWIAANRGAEVIGININDNQIEQAEELAVERGVEDLVEFRQDDFTELDKVDDGEVTAFVSFEALCYATDKRDVLEQAARVLEDGGRLSVADGYETKSGSSEDPDMRKWLDGWKVDALAHVDKFTDDLSDLGFRSVQAHDITDNVLPGSKIMYKKSRRFGPLVKAGSKLGVYSSNEVGHIVAGRYQYETLDDLWGYFIVTGER